MKIERGYKTDLKFKSLLEAVKYFSDEQVCRKYLERKRWGDNVTCLRCGHDAVMRLGDGKTFKCKKCRRKFSLTSGTIFEDSNLPLSKWLPALYLFMSRSKGISSVQLAKDLGVQQNTSWYMGQRFRDMIVAKNLGMLAGVVEIDETYIKDGKKLGARTAKIRGLQGRSLKQQTPLIAMKQRNGKVIVVAVPDTTKATIKSVIGKHIVKGSTIVTDGCPAYKYLSKEGEYKHEALNHSKKEYVRDGYHTNNVEAFWAYAKKCWHGTHHWISSKHLWRYCAEWSFRYNTSANAKAMNRHKNIERFEMVMDMFSVQTTCKQIVDFIPEYAIAA